MPFEKDVFISYAHLDNQVLPMTQDGWVSVFEDCLRVFLSEYLGRSIEVWRDPRLESNTIFGDEILESLEKSAVMVAILSPRYIQSEWCVKELTQFWSASQKARLSRIGNASRIFKAEKIPVEDYPSELAFLKNQISCNFFERDPSKGEIREVRIEFNKQQFYLRVSDLAKDITKMLKVLDEYSGEGGDRLGEAINQVAEEVQSLAAQSLSGQTPAGQSSADPSSDIQTAGDLLAAKRATEIPIEKTVYLATTTSDLQATRDNIKRELETRGYLVLPQQPLPLELDDFAQQVRADLKRSRLSIHLMGQAYGTVPEGSTHSIIALQNLLAIEHSEATTSEATTSEAAKAFPRLIWLRPGLSNIKDERQQKLVRHLQRDADAQRSADILQISLEELKNVVLSKLRSPVGQSERARAGTPTQAANGQPPAASNAPSGGAVYLDFDQQDLSNPQTKKELQQILSCLKQRYKTVYMPSQDQAIVSFVDDKLKQCDGILIYHGLGDKNWLEGRWKAATKAMGYTTANRRKVRSIYLGSPDTPLKRSLLKQGQQQSLPIIKGGNFCTSQLEPFFGNLASAQEASS